jgi:hypothetical protein
MGRTIKFSLLIAGISLVFLYSCNKNKNSIPVVYVTPSDINIVAHPGNILTFDVTADGDNDALSRFIIQNQAENQSRLTILDTSITGKKFTYTYQYKVPDTLTGSVFITFSVYDKDGDIGEAATRIIIDPISTKLTEYPGDIIYSRFSGKQDALHIYTNAPEFSALAPLSLLDIADYDTIQSDSTLANQWYSPAGNKFVRFNGFDYANATNSSAGAAYNSGQKLDIISSLNINDIIITKANNGGSAFYAVIKITNIVEASSTINDRYEFNLLK